MAFGDDQHSLGNICDCLCKCDRDECENPECDGDCGACHCWTDLCDCTGDDACDCGEDDCGDCAESQDELGCDCGESGCFWCDPAIQEEDEEDEGP